MMQPQVPLQLNNKKPFKLDGFIGAAEVVQNLKNFQDLPPFTYLWGAKYSGKTYLVTALASELKRNGFESLVIDAMKITNNEVLDNLPPSVKYLIIEDVCQLKGKKFFETALFNLYNSCLSQNIKLLVTASISQRSEQWQLPDLRSRLSAGLTLSLDVLKGDEAINCMVQQFVVQGMPLDAAVIHYLKTTQNSSLANLYPLFERLSLDSLRLKKKVTIPMIKNAVADIQQSEQ